MPEKWQCFLEIAFQFSAINTVLILFLLRLVPRSPDGYMLKEFIRLSFFDLEHYKSVIICMW